MTTAELIQQIKSAGLYPIQVEGDAERDKGSDSFFVGSLEEFFAAAKVLESKTMFFFVGKLDKEDFLYDSEYDEEEDFDEEIDSDRSGKNEENFDLTVALPSLADFRKQVGKEYAFLLTAKNQLASLSFYLAESWWDSFVEQRGKAIQKVDENREAMREKMQKQQEEKEDALLKQVRSLLNDPEFSRIPTQRGMKAYAIEKFPELEEVDESSLVEEIRKLDDKLKARKRK